MYHWLVTANLSKSIHFLDYCFFKELCELESNVNLLRTLK